MNDDKKDFLAISMGVIILALSLLSFAGFCATQASGAPADAATTFRLAVLEAKQKEVPRVCSWCWGHGEVDHVETHYLPGGKTSITKTPFRCTACGGRGVDYALGQSARREVAVVALGSPPAQAGVAFGTWISPEPGTLTLGNGLGNGQQK